MEEQINEILIKINQSKQELNRLYNEPIVQQYLNVIKEKEGLLKDCEKLVKEHQSQCKHGMWYKISENADDYECRTYYVCKCLKCGKQKEDRSKDFDGFVIDTKVTYEKVKNLYEELNKITNNNQLLFELIKEKL